MNASRLVQLVTVLALATAACGGPRGAESEDTPASKDNAGKMGTAEKPAPAVAPSPSPADLDNASAKPGEKDKVEPPPATIDVDKVLADPRVGLDVCDAYVTTHLRCIEEHAPADEKAALRLRLAEEIAAWKQTKSGAQGADVALKIGCKTAMEGAKAATATWGCTW